MTRLKDNKSQALETWATASVEGFADFTNSRLYINPATGAVSVGMRTKRDVDGKEIYTMDDDPNSFMTINQMQGRIKAKFDRFDVNAALDGYVGSVGESIRLVETMGKLGGKTVSEFLNAPDKQYADVAFNFVKAETDALTAFMANPYNTSSIMTENIKGKNGNIYEFTQDENEAKADGSKIYVYTDPKSGMVTPKYTPDQEKDVLEWLRGQARLRYDQKMTTKDVKYKAEFAPHYPEEWEVKSAQGRTKLMNEGNFIAKLYSGTDAEIDAAVKHFNGYSTTSQLSRTPTGVTITYKDGSSKPFDFKSGNTLVTKNDFIQGIAPMLLGDNIDVNVVLKGAVGASSDVFNPTASASATTTYKKSVMDQYSTGVKSKIKNAATAIGQSEEEAVGTLASAYGNYGFTFEETGIGVNRILITAPNGKKTTIDVNESGNKAAATAKAVESFVLGNTTNESIVKGVGMGGEFD
jgi:hypothetical protein